MFRAFRTKTSDQEANPLRLQITALGCALAFTVALGTAHVSAQSATETIERLLPAQTIAVLTVPSVNAVQAILDRWYTEFQGDGTSGESETPNVRDELSEFVALERQHIDTTRPVAVVFSLALAGAAPMPTIIVPVRDEDAALTSLEAGSSSPFSATHATGRGYLVMTSAPQYAPDVGTFVLDAPRDPRDVRVAVDIATVYQMYGPMLEFFLSSMLQGMQAETSDSAALEATVRAAEWVQSVLGNAERLEIALATSEEQLRLTSTLRSRPGSPPVVPVRDSERMLELSRILDADASLIAVASADMRAFYDWSMAAQQFQLKEQLEATPQQGEQIMALLEYSTELQRLLTGPNAYSLGIDASGVQVVQVMQLEQPSAFVETFRGIMASMQPLEPLGLALVEDDVTRLESVDVYTWRIRLEADFIRVQPEDGDAPWRDFSEVRQRLFGADEGVVRMAIVDDVALFVLHPDERRMRAALKRLKSKSGDVPKTIRRLADRHEGTPWLAAQTDLRAVAAGFIDIVLNPDAVRDPQAWRDLMNGDPVPVSISSSQRDGVLHCEFATNVHALAELVDALSRVFPENTNNPAHPDG